VLTGFTSRFKLVRNSLRAEPVTRQSISPAYEALDTRAFIGSYVISSTTVTSATATTVTVGAVAASVQVGDVIRFSAGNDLAGQVYHIQEINGLAITVACDFPVTPTGGNALTFERYVPLSLSSAGLLSLAANSSVNVAQYGGVDTTLGQKTMALSMPVTLASNQSTLVGSYKISSTTVTSATSTTVTVGAVDASVQVGDVIRFSAGNVLSGLIFYVQSVAGLVVTLASAFPVTPTSGNALTFERFIPVSLSSTGLLSTSLGAGAPDVTTAFPPANSAPAFAVRNLGFIGAPGTIVHRTTTPQLPIGYSFVTSVTSGSGSTTGALVCSTNPSTLCQRGDIVKITSGTQAQGFLQWGSVSSVSASTITLDTQTPLSVAIPAGLSIGIYRPSFLAVDSEASLLVKVANAVVPVSLGTNNTLNYEGGNIAFGSITGSLATFYTVLTNSYWVRVTNATNQILTYSLDGGVTKDVLTISQSMQFDMSLLGGHLASGSTIQIAHEGVAPTSGKAYVFLAYFF